MGEEEFERAENYLLKQMQWVDEQAPSSATAELMASLAQQFVNLHRFQHGDLK